MTDTTTAGAHVRIPGSQIIVTYASQCERDRSLRLAEARQALAHDGVLRPPWAGLTEAEREHCAIEAWNWLIAAIWAGIAAPCPVHADAECSAVGEWAGHDDQP
jgi:hypothetical protein